jgi:hypothetical protein
MNIRRTLAILLTIFFWRISFGQSTRFAIVVDKETYKLAQTEIDLYKATLDAEGLTTEIVVDRWNHPDSIRSFLKKQYTLGKAFEGAVFIGNIPIPMIRDAQHLTSAFKMDQDKYAWSRSSVPSDRFYEDFDLKFDYLKQDTITPSYFYYGLRYDSPQSLSPDIYTGRIKIYNDEDCSRLKAYLRKVVAAHREQNVVDEVLFFAGHGYNSESWIARMDEKVALLQQFPQLNRQANGLEYIDHSFDTHIKHRLLAQLEREDLDIALLHHHGGATAQYLNGSPKVDGVNQSIDNLKYYIRSKMQDAVRRKRDLDKTIESYMKTYGFPREWFENFDDPEVMKEDSIFWSSMDISSEELDNYNANARFIMFDACFNGSFHKPDYLSSKYVFGAGRTIAAQGNTVNAIQDKFPDRYIGLLSTGMRVGEWNRMVCYLESHIIGDPTFRFTPTESKNSFQTIKGYHANNKKIVGLLNNPLPDVRSWALRTLYINGYPQLSELLKRTYLQSPIGTERLECLLLLAELRDDNFLQVLQMAFDDSYELVRRSAAILAWKTGDPRIAPQVAKAMVDPNCPDRVRYHLREAIGFFDKDLISAELAKVDYKDDFNGYKKKIVEETKVKVDSSWSAYLGYMKDITSPTTSAKDRDFAIRALRNKTYHQGVNQLIQYFGNCNNEQIQISLLEVLGWYRYSYNKRAVVSFCQKVIADEKVSKAIKQEAERTINRLK